ncbi:peptidoglycan-binding protein, partial [Candidatus Peregrinibacteria bacterium]|nr:peptidoglycan-binding protein [Candidatus Peregrinibacteria bacterium]
MKKIFRLFSILVSLSVCLVLFEPFAYSSNNDDAFAKQLEGGEAQPYLKTFTVSAYYSPLPCQSRYATGSYDGDIRLNGGGVRGADGSPVYPGMIAAPKSYAYGIKMHIPGVGIVAVHDRGGAIRESMGIPGIYDRLDVWMGYGDKGLQRALKWGKRTVDTLVYGQNDSIVEQISLTDYSPEEKNQCSNGYVEPVAVTVTPAVPQPVMITYLSSGSSGEAVKALQTELKRLNYFKEDITGNYGEVTEHAVFKFQQSQNLVGDLSSVGAGIFGPKTRDRLNEIIASRSYTSV